MNAVVAILGLQVLIVFHELGHYLFARWFGMRVERFSVGFGPKLLGWTRGGTTFQLTAVPLGGFVQIAGMNPEEAIALGDTGVYPNKPMWQRFVVVLMGPVANLVIAYVFLTAAFAHGVEKVDTSVPLIGAVQPGSLAEHAGIAAGDRVLAIDGTQVQGFEDIPNLVQKKGAAPTVVVSIARGEETLTISVPPDADGARPKVLGLLPSRTLVKSTSLPAALVDGAVETAKKTGAIVSAIAAMFGGHGGRLVGLPGIVKMIGGEAARGVSALLAQLAVLSINLGLFNLLPIPALDGGRLVFLGYEGALKRRANIRVENIVQTAGMALLIALLVVVSVRDLLTR